MPIQIIKRRHWFSRFLIYYRFIVKCRFPTGLHSCCYLPISICPRFYIIVVLNSIFIVVYVVLHLLSFRFYGIFMNDVVLIVFLVAQGRRRS